VNKQKAEEAAGWRWVRNWREKLREWVHNYWFNWWT